MANYTVRVPEELEPFLQQYVDSKNRPDPVLGTPVPITKEEAVNNQVIPWLKQMETDSRRREAQLIGVDYDALSEADQAEVRALIDSKK